MNLTIDHLIIAVHDLDQAVQDYRDLGFTVIYGGVHAAGTTHNALVCFQDGAYFELLAPTGKPPVEDTQAVDFSHLTAGDEGFVGFALYADDLEAAASLFSKQGLAVSAIAHGSRIRQDGVILKWRTVTIDSDLYPFAIQDETPRNLRVPMDKATVTHENGATGITGFTVPAHHERIQQAFAPFKTGVDTFKLGDVDLTLGHSGQVTLAGLANSPVSSKTHGIQIKAQSR